MSANNTPTALGDMQAQLLTIRDLALFANAEQKAYLLQAADLIEQAVREYDREAD
jgi:hypothetical protein